MSVSSFLLPYSETLDCTICTCIPFQSEDMADRSPSQPDDHGLHVITLMVKVTVGDFLWPKDAGFFSGMICQKDDNLSAMHLAMCQYTDPHRRVDRKQLL